MNDKTDFEVNETGTVRVLNLNQMALVLALKVIDATMKESCTHDEMDQAQQDLRDLNELRRELGVESELSERSVPTETK